MKAFYILPLLLLLLSGCATPGPWFEPLPPGSLRQDHQARQQITATTRGRTYSLQTLVKTNGHSILIVALSDLGQRLFTLKWKAGEPAPRHVGEPPDAIRPDWVLADLQLALWPLDSLKRALPPDLRLEQASNTRMLWRGAELLWLRISDGTDAWSSTMVIHNLKLKYDLRVQPLAFAALQP